MKKSQPTSASNEKHWPLERDPLSSTCRGIANIPIWTTVRMDGDKRKGKKEKNTKCGFYGLVMVDTTTP